jgi:magnesium-transporting ATPase (P-type)
LFEKRFIYFLKIVVCSAITAIAEDLPAVATTTFPVCVTQMAKSNAVEIDLKKVETEGYALLFAPTKQEHQQ